MVHTILTGVVQVLHERYPNHECWIDRVPQRQNPPCFYIEAIAPDEGAEFDCRFRLTVPVRVRYFPASEDGPREECEQVASQLYDALEFIMADGLRRGQKAGHRIEDGILYFNIIYRAFYVRMPEELMMGTLELGLQARKETAQE